MEATEVFEKACEAWGVEVRTTNTSEFTTKRELFFEDRPLHVSWNPEVSMDLAAKYGKEAEQKLVLTLVERIAMSLMGMKMGED